MGKTGVKPIPKSSKSLMCSKSAAKLQDKFELCKVSIKNSLLSLDCLHINEKISTFATLNSSKHKLLEND